MEKQHINQIRDQLSVLVVISLCVLFRIAVNVCLKRPPIATDA